MGKDKVDETIENKVINLNDFLKPLNSNECTMDVWVSDRFPAPFTIRKLTGKDQMVFSQKYENASGNKKTEAGLELIVQSCVNPNFKSVDVFNKVQTKRPTDAVLELLWADELTTLLNAVATFNGAKSTTEIREDAKN